MDYPNSSIPFFDLRNASLQPNVDLQGFWSYPAFEIFPNGKGKAECVWVYLILSTQLLSGKQKTALFRPKAMVMTPPDSTKILQYHNYRFGIDPFPSVSWSKPVAMYPYASIEGYSREQILEKEAELLRECVRQTECFIEKKGLLDEEFAQTWVELCHPVFLPYLKHLTPNFLRALDLQRISEKLKGERRKMESID